MLCCCFSVLFFSLFHHLHHHRHRGRRRCCCRCVVQHVYNTITPIRCTNSKKELILLSRHHVSKQNGITVKKEKHRNPFNSHITHRAHRIWMICIVYIATIQHKCIRTAFPYPLPPLGKTNTLTQSTNKKSIHHHHHRHHHMVVFYVHTHTLGNHI